MVRMNTYIHAYTWHTYLPTYIHYMYADVYIYIYTYIHTCIHTYSRNKNLSLVLLARSGLIMAHRDMVTQPEMCMCVCVYVCIHVLGQWPTKTWSPNLKCVCVCVCVCMYTCSRIMAHRDMVTQSEMCVCMYICVHILG